MSTATPRLVPIRLRPPRPRPPRIPHRALVRTAVRQHRTVLAAAAICLAALSAWALRTAATTADVQTALNRTGCRGRVFTDACSSLADPVGQALQTTQQVQFALLAVPVLVGALLGAPLLAREYEHGTHRLAWTQSVPRRRWLTSHLIVLGGAATTIGAVAALLGTRIHAAATPALAYGSSGFDALPYNAFGPVLAAATLLAFALGVLTGSLIRRTVPAIGITILGHAGLTVLLTWLRRWLQPQLTRFPPHGYDLSPDDWLLWDGVLTSDGHRLPYAQCPDSGCPADSRTLDVYHSAGQLWPMQWTQGALMVALAAALLAAAYRSIRRNRL
ncbi:ABC transporter permease [Kitasatospora sp. NPDC059795]|uniref:ABC transporter permease n=1 Tax=Kitasatospora sp. NPDC059795 TaxID=3346949 RepID=UPI00365F0D39